MSRSEPGSACLSRLSAPAALAPVGAGVLALRAEVEHALMLLADIAGRYDAGAVRPDLDDATAAWAVTAAPDLSRIAADLACLNTRLRRAAGLRRTR